jgi:hypothetical protein
MCKKWLFPIVLMAAPLIGQENFQNTKKQSLNSWKIDKYFIANF